MNVVFFDTSILLAALITQHPDHERSFRWLAGAKAKRFNLIVAQHTLMELQVMLTSLGTRPKITPGVAERLIRSNIEAGQVISLTPAAHWSALEKASRAGARGTAVYDHLNVQAALGAGAQNLLTLNPKLYSKSPDAPRGFVITP
ncbi:MAG: PIN domain-containing protein [Armatimonadota bacterium]